MTTKILSAVNILTIALFTAFAWRAEIPWWIWLLTLLFGLSTGAWAFSCGWDAALGKGRK